MNSAKLPARAGLAIVILLAMTACDNMNSTQQRMLSGGAAWGLVKLLGNGSYTSTLKGVAVLEVNTFTVLPGLIFGLIIGFLWHRRGMLSQLGVLGYALAAGVAFFLSFHIALNIFDRLSGLSGPMREDAALVVSGIIAGLIGCCFLGIVTARGS